MDRGKFRVIRSERILESIEEHYFFELEEKTRFLIEAIEEDIKDIDNYILQEATLDALMKNIIRGFPATTRRQFATAPVEILQKTYVPYRNTGNLLVQGTAYNAEPIPAYKGKQKQRTSFTYYPDIMFDNVIYEDEDAEDNITFTAKDGEQYHIKPLVYAGNNAKVRCQCLDFFYRFAQFNAMSGDLYGGNYPRYHRKTDWAPPANPMRVPGFCKHIIKLSESMEEDSVLTRKAPTAGASFKKTTIVPPSEIPPTPKGEPTAGEEQDIETAEREYDQAKQEYDQAQKITNPEEKKNALTRILPRLQNLYGKLKKWGSKFPRWLRGKFSRKR